MLDDLMAAFRALRRSPGFVVVAVVVLAAGFAVTGAVFSTINGWLAVSTAIPHAERLVVVAPVRHGYDDPSAYFNETSYERLFDLKLRTVRDLFATAPYPAVLSADTGAVSVRMEAVTSGYFRAVDVPPLIGRVLAPFDDRVGSDVAIVLGEAAWRRLFAADPRVVGRTVRLSGILCTIVGVMPASVRGFVMPTSTVVDIWAPTSAVRPLLVGSGKAVWAQVFGRLAEGASPRQAEAEMRVVSSGFDPDDREVAASVLPVERGVMPARTRLAIGAAGTGLVALSSLVLLIACANLANLLLARGVMRTSEIAVRMALGAQPSRILRQQLFETGCMAALGGAVGLTLVSWFAHLVGRFAVDTGGGHMVTGDILVNGWVLAFFFVLVAGTAVAIGVLPALRAIRTPPGQVMASLGGPGRTTGRFERRQAWLVATQVAASTVLLVVAGLFVRSALNASSYRVAFDADLIAMANVRLPGAAEREEPSNRLKREALLLAARSMPGVRGAAISTGLPAQGGGELVDIEAQDAHLGPREFGPPCRRLAVSPGFFAAIGPLRVRGREFTAADDAGGPGVAVVSETAALRLWPGRDPIRQQLRIRKSSSVEVVGVVADVDKTTKDPAERCSVFVPMAQLDTSRFVLLAVARVPQTSSLLAPLAAAVSRAVPEAEVSNVTTADAYLNQAAGASRTAALALTALGGLGMTIALVGLYGVMSYVVGLRRSEFGVRKVLGATDAQIYRLVTGEACRPLAIGILTGLPVAFIVSASATRLLVGIAPYDAATYLLVPTGLAVIGLVAAWWPARRAARVETAVVLRTL